MLREGRQRESGDRLLWPKLIDKLIKISIVAEGPWKSGLALNNFFSGDIKDVEEFFNLMNDRFFNFVQSPLGKEQINEFSRQLRNEYHATIVLESTPNSQVDNVNLKRISGRLELLNQFYQTLGQYGIRAYPFMVVTLHLKLDLAAKRYALTQCPRDIYDYYLQLNQAIAQVRQLHDGIFLAAKHAIRAIPDGLGHFVVKRDSHEAVDASAFFDSKRSAKKSAKAQSNEIQRFSALGMTQITNELLNRWRQEQRMVLSMIDKSPDVYSPIAQEVHRRQNRGLEPSAGSARNCGTFRHRVAGVDESTSDEQRLIARL